VFTSHRKILSPGVSGQTQPRLLWLSKEVQAEISRILGHAPGQLRQRYWSEGSRTLWILEETGKEDLITAGFVIREGAWSRRKCWCTAKAAAWKFVTPLFESVKGMFLVADNRLDHGIDGISARPCRCRQCSAWRVPRCILTAWRASPRERKTRIGKTRIWKTKIQTTRERAMSWIIHHLRILRRWHARIGVAAMLYLPVLVVSGWALNHGADLELDGREITAPWLMRWYGIEAVAPSLGYALGDTHFVWSGEKWALGNHKLKSVSGEPTGAVESAGIYYLATASTLYLYQADGSCWTSWRKLLCPDSPSWRWARQSTKSCCRQPRKFLPLTTV